MRKKSKRRNQKSSAAPASSEADADANATSTLLGKAVVLQRLKELQFQSSESSIDSCKLVRGWTVPLLQLRVKYELCGKEGVVDI